MICLLIISVMDIKGKFGDTTPSLGGAWVDNVDQDATADNTKIVDEMLDELRLMKTK